MEEEKDRDENTEEGPVYQTSARHLSAQAHHGQETQVAAGSESVDRTRASDAGRENVQTSQERRGQVAGSLEDELTNEKLTHLQGIFAGADEDGGGGLDMEEFRHAMRQTMGDHVTDKDLDKIFMKVDTNCDGTVDWDEYLTYMLLECREKDSMNVIAAQPFPKRIRQVKGTHRDSVVGLMFLPYFLSGGPARSREEQERFDRAHGRYVSVSKDGVVNYWGLDMKLLGAFSVDAEPGKGQKTASPLNVWVTDIAYLSQSNFLAVSTTRRDIMFYDMNGNRFQRLSRVSGLEGCVITMMFHHVQDSRSTVMTEDMLVWGDSIGGVSAIVFNKLPQLTSINPKLKKNSRVRIAFQEILTNKVPHLKAYYLPKVHGDLVRQIRFSQNMGCVMSCCKDSNTAMFLGDLEKKVTKSYFKVPKGINSFDYCKRTNVIITGGYDTVIRVWNPYVPSKPVILLRGHKSPVLFILHNAKKEHVISVAENKEVRIHDLNTQTCIQTFYRKMMTDLGLRPITAATMNPSRQVLILATTTFAYLESREDDSRGQALTSHAQPITVAIYNPLFEQVVSAGDDGLVCVWALSTGEKVMQFLAHWNRQNGVVVSVGVSTMVFGPSMRRLITAAEDGTVKIWNFNNGACLRELQRFDDQEVRGIVCPKQRIVTAGWNKRITVYQDRADDESCSWLMPQHLEDVEALAYYPPYTLASGSTNGNIFLWSLETGRVLCCLNAVVSPLPQTPSAYINSGYYAPNKVDPSLMNLHLGDDMFIQRMYRSTKKLKLGEEVKDDDTEVNDENEAINRRSSFLDDVKTLHYARKAMFTRRERQQRPCLEKLLFLVTREHGEHTATLLAGSSDGFVRAWSIHHDGGLLGQFCVTHKSEDSVSAMISDDRNRFLITCDTSGYIKVWHIAEYCIRLNKEQMQEVKESSGKIYAGFPFLNWRINMLRMSKGPKWLRRILSSGQCPTLLNSFRGHLQAITSVDFVELAERQMIITSSTDCSVRVWTLQGTFLGVFGQPDLWTTISDSGSLMGQSDSPHVRKAYCPPGKGAKKAVVFQAQVGFIPPDIRRVASATTLAVLNSNRHPLWSLAKHMVTWLTLYPRRDSPELVETPTLLPRVDSQQLSNYDKDYEPESSILGRGYHKLTRHRELPTLPKIRQFSTQVAAYCSLPCVEMEEIKPLKPPQIIKEIRQRNQVLSVANSVTQRKCVRSVRKAGWALGHKNRRRSMFSAPNSQCNSDTNLASSTRMVKKSLPPNDSPGSIGEGNSAKNPRKTSNASEDSMEGRKSGSASGPGVQFLLPIAEN